MSVNKAIIIGNLGRDPEIKFTQNGQAVCNFSVATTEKWRGKSGSDQEQTEWHRIVTWGKLAEICGEHLSKGRQVYVEGRIQTREWNDKQGEKRYTTEINAREVKFLGGRDGASRGASSNPPQHRPHNDPYSASGDDGSGDVPF